METNKEFIFESWAPPGGIWSDWAKPVLFAFIGHTLPEAVPLETVELPDWLPAAGALASSAAEDSIGEGALGSRDAVESGIIAAPGDGRAPGGETAIVLDLPGDFGIRWGLALAQRGYRPVPLYNAVPFPTLYETEGRMYEADVTLPSVALVDVMPILVALCQAAPALGAMELPDTAPPVFLLDANRRIGCAAPSPGKFDNRSISFTTDFPSANFLQSKGVRKIVLVQNYGSHPQSDLAHTFRRWQEAGLPIEVKGLDQSGPPIPCLVERPSRFGWFWYRVAAAIGLRRHRLGGFGGMVPDPESGWGAAG